MADEINDDEIPPSPPRVDNAQALSPDQGGAFSDQGEEYTGADMNEGEAEEREPGEAVPGDEEKDVNACCARCGPPRGPQRTKACACRVLSVYRQRDLGIYLF